MSNAAPTPSAMNPSPNSRRSVNQPLSFPAEAIYSNGEYFHEPLAIKDGTEFNSTAEERAPVIIEERSRSSESYSNSMPPRSMLPTQYNSASFRSSQINQGYPRQLYSKRASEKSAVYQQIPNEMADCPNASRFPFPNTNHPYYISSPSLDSRSACNPKMIYRAI